MSEQLPDEVMKKAVKGISYIAHPLRLRILEFIDVNGAFSFRFCHYQSRG